MLVIVTLLLPEISKAPLVVSIVTLSSVVSPFTFNPVSVPTDVKLDDVIPDPSVDELNT